MNVERSEFEIRFEDLSVAEAGTKASRLRRELLDASSDVDVTIKKDDPENLDFGATLVLVLGAPAVVAIAHGIASYLKRHGGSVTITKDGSVIAKNISGDDVARITEALAKRDK
jgi:hypothetical protein